MTFAANLAALARRIVGISAGNLVALDANGKLPAVPGDLLTGLTFSHAFESAEISIVSGGTFSVTHGLGGVPKVVNAVIVCKTAEGGYSVGDRCPIWIGCLPTSGGFGLVKSATTLAGAFGSASNSWLLNNKTTGTQFTATNANWRLVLEAYA